MDVAAAGHIADAVQAVAVLLRHRLGAPVAHGVEIGDAAVRRRLGKIVEQLVIGQCARLDHDMVEQPV